MKNLIAPGAVPVRPRPPAGSTTRASTPRRCAWRWTSPATTSCVASRPRSAPRGELMGIGISFFTEGVGAGPRKHMDILGLGMADGAELRVHPRARRSSASVGADARARATRRRSRRSSPRSSASRRRTSRSSTATPTSTPFGLGTYGSRSTPVSGAAVAVVVAQGARQGAPDRGGDARVLARRPRVGEGPLVRQGRPGARARRSRRSRCARTAALELPEGVEGHLDAQVVYDPPNLTYPYGCLHRVVDVDPGTGQVKVRRFIAVDDCGARINPMIVEGQIHGGLADGVGMALMEVIAFDEDGNCLGGSFMDYLLPDRARVPRLGARRDGHAVARTTRSAPRASASRPTSGSPPAIVNAVIDALHATHGVATSTCPAPRPASGRRCRAHVRTTAVAADDDRPRGRARAGRGARADGHAVRARHGRARASARRAPRPATRRSCSPTARSRGSSAARARRRRVRVARARRRSRPGEPLLLRIVPTPSRGRPEQSGRGGAVGAQPVPVRRRARDLPRAGAARAASSCVVGDTPDRGGAGRGRRRARARRRRRGRRWRRSAPTTVAVVVAAHGRDEVHALRRALEAGVPYVGLVASPKRGAGVLDELRADGVPEEQLARSTSRPGSTSAPARPPRSRCRSSPRSSPCAAGARRCARRALPLLVDEPAAAHARRSTRSAG